MKKTIILLIFFLTNILFSCTFDTRGYEFNNFNNTPAWELAKAVRDNDVEQIRAIVQNKNIDIDYKEPKWNQTLLILAIVNQKREAFNELLSLGANPNLIVGKAHESSPLIAAINYQNKHELFYIASLLKKGANPNLLIVPDDGKYFFDYYPLFAAIGRENEGFTGVCELLIKYGADINCCSPKKDDSGICDGVISKCLILSNIELLRYFIVDKKIKIPCPAYVSRTIEGTSQRIFTLTEILNTDKYKFEDFTEDGQKTDFSTTRKARTEILDYLKKTGQK